MKRPIESNYTSQVAYTRALEEYCDELAQPEQEPVAWPVGSAELHIGLLNMGKAMAKERSREIGDAWNQLANLLYLLTKARSAQSQRKPLTTEQIWEIAKNLEDPSWRQIVDVIEAAHGIKENT